MDIIIIINFIIEVAKVLTEGLPFLSSKTVLKYYKHGVFALSLRV